MTVNFKTKAICQIDIESDEAFRILCKTLHMEFITDEDRKFYVNESGEVWESVSGCSDRCIDDRGGLFIALRNVAVNIFPNTSFRGADYIYSQ